MRILPIKPHFFIIRSFFLEIGGKREYNCRQVNET